MHCILPSLQLLKQQNLIKSEIQVKILAYVIIGSLPSKLDIFYRFMYTDSQHQIHLTEV